MSNEDKKMSRFSKQKPNFRPDPIITMWIKLEGNPDFGEFIVEKNDYPNNPNYEKDIQVFALSDPGNPQILSPKTTLESLSITNSTELLVRYPLSDLSIQVKDQKPYSDWKMKEISRIYDDAFESSEMIDRFKIEDLPELSAHFSEELQCFFDDLKRKLQAFQVISSNDVTCHEYISIFLTWAVNYIRKHIDNTARLAVEIEVNGSHGYGSFDYAIFIRYILALVTEAKLMDMEKVGKKRNSEQAGLDNCPEVMFGIVTSGIIWRFIRVSGPLKSPKVEITAEYNSGLTSNIEIMNYDYAKEVLCCIARVLQAQVVNDAKRPRINYISG
ncbi:hypothetical protein C2G38_2173373 [Gigaspora rosea]|uniref:Uncharacterized protein n=1 Tax=Gigaspora rosea TaxID=44941 RepID=A0A397VUI3_9GLOM|nr:hypothetical protein C2G38_2173373 [Gigaspora rosea]